MTEVQEDQATSSLSQTFKAEQQTQQQICQMLMILPRRQ